MAELKTQTADDGDALFAAMADDAIRQMLDEAPPAKGETPAPVAATAASPEVELDPDEAAALAEGDAGPDEHDGVTTMPTDAELDALLRGESPPEPDEVATPKPWVAAKAAHEPHEQPPSPAATALAAELDADPAPPAAPVTPAATKEEPPAAPKLKRGTPLWLAPLVWLNAPFARAPQPARDALGKVGLVTLLNAAAVIVYAVVIRR